MSPEPSSVLAEMAQLMVRNAAPDVPPAERASALGLSAALLAVAAEVWDGEAQRLVEENRELARLLDDAAAEADLRISRLSAENARLRTRLIAAQTAAEAAGDTDRQDAIWTALRQSTERRRLSMSVV